MTDLERFAAAILTQWRAGNGTGGGPIAIGSLLDELFPYRVARRSLGIDASEDYEALMLRFLAEEEGLAEVYPVGASEMARTTMASRLPDLDVLQLLRSGTVTVSAAALSRLDGVLPMPTPKEEAKRPAKEEGRRAPKEEGKRMPKEETRWAPAAASASAGAPSDARCWSCSEALPTGREVKFCHACGADQRQPMCKSCGASVERQWKHCVECGAQQ